ncbi:MAG: protein kinase [Myxococcota bacterium]
MDAPVSPREAPTSSVRRPRLQTGDRVGDYEITGRLGSGAFGHVYAVIHTVIGKRAALKVLHAEHTKNPAVTRRFLDEAKAVNAIQHQGIVDIFDFGALADGSQFFAMELLNGETLQTRLERDRRFDINDALPLLRRVARALDAAHDAGIAHRDLKPENIFLTYDDEGAAQPKLLDFGIAKLMGEGKKSQTQTGQTLGTPLYMSPEQWRGRSVDHRTDIWSLGVVAYQMLGGVLPFDGESPGDVMIHACTESPRPLREVAPHLAEPIGEAVVRMLAKLPQDRPDSASEAIRRLGDITALIASGLAPDTFDTMDTEATLVPHDGATHGAGAMASNDAPMVPAHPTASTPRLPTADEGAPPARPDPGAMTSARPLEPHPHRATNAPVTTGPAPRPMRKAFGYALAASMVGAGGFVAWWMSSTTFLGAGEAEAAADEISPALASPEPTAVADESPVDLAPASSPRPEYPRGPQEGEDAVSPNPPPPTPRVASPRPPSPPAAPRASSRVRAAVPPPPAPATVSIKPEVPPPSPDLPPPPPPPRGIDLPVDSR